MGCCFGEVKTLHGTVQEWRPRVHCLPVPYICIAGQVLSCLWLSSSLFADGRGRAAMAIPFYR